MKDYPLFKVHIDKQAALREIERVFDSGYVNEGVQVAELQDGLKKYLGDVTLTNSCTSALTLALHVSGVQEGDEVVSTPMTCVATNVPISTCGAKVVWADIEPATGMIDPRDLERKITQKTKAVMYVAWAGSLGPLDEVSRVCSKYGVPLILDAAHAFGARYNGKVPVETGLVDFACYSMQAIKHVTTGDGGAIAVKANVDRQRVKNLKWFGMDRNASKDDKGDWKGQQWDVDIREPGFKFNMNNVNAAIGLSQLPHVDWILEKHKRNALMFDKLFAPVRDIEPLHRSDLEDSARWVYTLRTPHRDEKRLEIVKKLNDQGVHAGLVHVPNDLYTCFKGSECCLPGTREFASTQFSIPCGWWLDDEDIVDISTKVIDAVYG